MTNFILVGVLVIILGAAIAYIVREKKRGVRCVGCPDGGQCSGSCSGHCEGGCGCKN